MESKIKKSIVEDVVIFDVLCTQSRIFRKQTLQSGYKAVFGILKQNEIYYLFAFYSEIFCKYF